jgi:hypothetical protein
MKAKLIGALIAACAAALCSSAFAGSDAPASDARTGGVMKASHPAEHGKRPVVQQPDPGGVGGAAPAKSGSGHREQPDSIDPMYRGG